MNKRLSYFHTLFSELQHRVDASLPELTRHDPDIAEQLRSRFVKVKSRIQAMSDREDYLGEGQDLLTQIIGHYPQLSPAIHRDLLWFFGGDCLHFLDDRELEHYQNLEERYYRLSRESGDADYRDLRAQEFGLH